MAATKKPARKRRIQASEIDVETRTLLGVLAELAEISKESAVRSARAEQMAAEAMQRFDMLWPTTQTMLRDLMALAADSRAHRERTEGRLDALEKVAAE
jgi:hypothetical protein